MVALYFTPKLHNKNLDCEYIFLKQFQFGVKLLNFFIFLDNLRDA